MIGFKTMKVLTIVSPALYHCTISPTQWSVLNTSRVLVVVLVEVVVALLPELERARSRVLPLPITIRPWPTGFLVSSAVRTVPSTNRTAFSLAYPVPSTTYTEPSIVCEASSTTWRVLSPTVCAVPSTTAIEVWISAEAVPWVTLVTDSALTKFDKSKSYSVYYLIVHYSLGHPFNRPPKHEVVKLIFKESTQHD